MFGPSRWPEQAEVFRTGRTGRYVGGMEETAGAAHPFSRSATKRLLDSACEAAGLPSDGAELLRLGENAIYQLQTPVVVRIARSSDYWPDASKEVLVARWLADTGIPAATVVDDLPQPMDVAGHPVTFWHFIRGKPGGAESVADLGRILREVHGTEPPAGLPNQDILGRVERRIRTAPISEDDRGFLAGRYAELRDELDRLDYPLSAGPAHGDAHTDNLMLTDDGPVLIDFERFYYGQPEWDIALMAVEQRVGWWTDQDYRTFCEAYGYDITDWKGFPILEAVHRLKMTTWLMQMVDDSPQIAQEHDNRMRSLRNGQSEARWRPF